MFFYFFNTLETMPMHKTILTVVHHVRREI